MPNCVGRRGQVQWLEFSQLIKPFGLARFLNLDPRPKDLQGDYELR